MPRGMCTRVSVWPRRTSMFGASSQRRGLQFLRPDRGLSRADHGRAHPRGSGRSDQSSGDPRRTSPPIIARTLPGTLTSFCHRPVELWRRTPPPPPGPRRRRTTLARCKIEAIGSGHGAPRRAVHQGREGRAVRHHFRRGRRHCFTIGLRAARSAFARASFRAQASSSPRVSAMCTCSTRMAVAQLEYLSNRMPSFFK